MRLTEHLRLLQPQSFEMFVMNLEYALLALFMGVSHESLLRNSYHSKDHCFSEIEPQNVKAALNTG
jgi:hypothetical protein